mmetsp:Transcript_40145/g.72729  ORF Transcript_40145/g.72729 Transcript_40145/m.72729 type:complete len:166 (-) Transcript_40145:166-663(-)
MMSDFIWRTSNADYGRHMQTRSQSCGAVQRESQDYVSMAEVLARRSSTKRPVTAPAQDLSRYPLVRARDKVTIDTIADPVLYADALPTKFPPKDVGFSYPPRATQSPLYRTEAMKVGWRVPEWYHVEDKWFPSRSFAKGFTDPAPRYTGIDTALERSKVHSQLEP